MVTGGRVKKVMVTIETAEVGDVTVEFLAEPGAEMWWDQGDLEITKVWPQDAEA